MNRARATIFVSLGVIAVLAALALRDLRRGPAGEPDGPALEFSGTVLDDRGKPLAVASVVALWIGQDAEPRALATTFADFRDGGYRLEAKPPAGELGVLVLTARAPGYQSAGRTVLGPDAEPVHRQDFRLLWGGTRVRVRVHDPQGRPVPGSPVTVSVEALAGDPAALMILQGVTDPDGSILFDSVPRAAAQLHWEARADRIGWAFGTQTKPREQAETTIIARLRPMAVLEVTVVDRRGGPVSDLAIVLAQAQGPWGDRAVPQGPGRFVVDVPSGLELLLRVDGDWVLFSGRDQMSVLVPSGASRHALELTVEPGGAIAGRVVNRAGKPVVNALVRLLPSDRNLTTDRAHATGADGRFRATGLREGATWDLEVRHPDHAPGFLEGIPVGDESLEIELSEGGAVAGRVLDDAGVGLGGVEVMVHRIEVQGEVTQGLREYASATTNGKGDYAVSRLNPGRYRVEIRPRKKMQWAPTASQVLDAEVVEGGTAHLADARLPRGGVLQGELRVDRGSASRRRLDVAILPEGKPGAPHRVVAQTNTQGGFLLDGLEEGSLAVTVRLPDLGHTTQVVTIQGGRTTEAIFTLKERLTLHGVVRRWDGKPAAGASLDAYANQGSTPARVPGRAADDMSGNRVLADRGGSFRLAGLEPGTYHLRVTQTDAPPLELDVAVPRSAPLDIELDRPAACEVILTDADGTPLPGKVIAAVDSARLYSGSAVTDENGRVRFDNLPPGQFQLAAMVQGQPSAERAIAEGETVSVRLQR